LLDGNNNFSRKAWAGGRTQNQGLEMGKK